MPKLTFHPTAVTIEVAPNTKVLAAASKAKVPIRFGCASLKCGTCGVAVSGDGVLTPMADDEKAMLTRLKLPTDGTIRMACRTRINDGEIRVDLDFQNTYSPDTEDEFE